MFVCLFVCLFVCVCVCMCVCLCVFSAILGLCCPSLPILGAMLAHFGCYVVLCHVGPCWGLGTMLAMLAHLGAMLAHLGSYVGPSWGYVGPSWGYVGPSWGLCWAKWDAFLGLCLAILTHLDPQVRKMGRSKKHCKTHDIRGVGGRGWAPSLSYGDWPGLKAYA